MSEKDYQRVDTIDVGDSVADVSGPGSDATANTASAGLMVRWFVIPLAAILCAFQSIINIVAAHTAQQYPTSTLISVLGFGIMVLWLLMFNPAKLWAQKGWRGRLFLIGGIAMPILVLHGVGNGYLALSATLIRLATWGAGLIILANALVRARKVDGADWLHAISGVAEWVLIFAVTYTMVTAAGATWPAFIPLVIFTGVLVYSLFTWGRPPLGRAELMCMVAAMLVTAGISTFGLADQLVPLIPAPWNAEWNTPQRGWDKRILPYLNADLYITDTDVIREFREGLRKDSEDRPINEPPEGASTSEWMKFYSSVAVNLPWGQWLRPLSLWMVFVAGCYGIFFSLAYLLLDYWSKREKLIFPLAKLHEAVLPDESSSSWVPAIFRQPLFWLGFVISVAVLGYNAAAIANWMPLSKLNLGMSGNEFTLIVEGTGFAGLGGGPGLKWLFIFTAIGISFLLPLEISFSIWFYFILGRLLILAMVRMGYGQNFGDYPSDWLWIQNAVSAQGAGGIMLFSAICIYRCVREYFVLSKGRDGLERLKLMMPVVGLVAAIAVVTLWISWNNVPLFWAFIFTMFLTLLTVGLMRIVAEGGVFWYQSHSSFFHFYKMLGLGKFLSPYALAPLMPIYSVLFLDIKTFIAPNILNAAKLHQDVGGSRLKFHLIIAVSTLVSIVVAIVFSIVLAYSRGAQRMSNWFYSGGPRSMIETAASATTMPPQIEKATLGWFSFGAFWVALSMYVRKTVFWFPHPIGYIMLINPLTNELWFSFFVGWVFKKIVVKYGGKTTFEKIRLVMLGLIIGELVAIFICGAITILPTGVRLPGIDLNRYAP